MIQNFFERDNNWKHKNGVTYYHKYADIPVFFEKNDEFWIIMDLRLRGQILKLSNQLDKENIKYYFLSPKLDWHFFTKKITNFTRDDQYLIIDHYFFLIMDQIFFKNIHKFEYAKVISNFIMKYGCMDLFKDKYDIIKKDPNYFMKFDGSSFWWNPKDKECKEEKAYFESLYRMVSINCFGI